jgi:hypothetical protein
MLAHVLYVPILKVHSTSLNPGYIIVSDVILFEEKLNLVVNSSSSYHHKKVYPDISG